LGNRHWSEENATESEKDVRRAAIISIAPCCETRY
jgi:hypothetical protein